MSYQPGALGALGNPGGNRSMWSYEVERNLALNVLEENISKPDPRSLAVAQLALQQANQLMQQHNELRDSKSIDRIRECERRFNSIQASIDERERRLDIQNPDRIRQREASRVMDNLFKEALKFTAKSVLKSAFSPMPMPQ